MTQNEITTIPPLSPFTVDEFRQRIEALQRHMADTGMSALFVTTPANIRYITGYSSEFWESPTRPWYVVVPRVGEPVAVVPPIGIPALEKTWITDIRSWNSDLDVNGTHVLAAVLKESSSPTGDIGAEFGEETSLRMPISALEELRGALSGRRLVNASREIWATRAIKSEAEIARVRRSCTLASDMYDAVPDLVRIGDTEAQAIRRLRAHLISSGADNVPFMPGRSGPGGLDEIVSGAGHRALAPGEVFFVDTGATTDGYFCDFDRNYAVGRISDDCAYAHELLWKATEAGLAASRPGATSHDLWQAMNEILAPHAVGGSGVGRFGHGVGLQLTEPPSHCLGDLTALVPGMVLAIEPSLEYAPGRVLVHEENIVVRPDGFELLTRRAPKEMLTISD